MPLTRIKLLRLKRGLYQWQVAQAIGVNESVLSKLETGRTKPSEEQLAKIATILEVSEEELQENPQ